MTRNGTSPHKTVLTFNKRPANTSFTPVLTLFSTHPATMERILANCGLINAVNTVTITSNASSAANRAKVSCDADPEMIWWICSRRTGRNSGRRGRTPVLTVLIMVVRQLIASQRMATSELVRNAALADIIVGQVSDECAPRMPRSNNPQSF